MKNGFNTAHRLLIILALTIGALAQLKAQVSSPPPCDGPLTIYFSLVYLGCDNPKANAKVIPNCGTLPFDYQWSNGTISSEILGVSPGTYTATVTDAKGLKAIGQVVVPNPPSSTLKVTASVNGSGCTSGPNGSVTLNMTGGTAPYDVKWYTNPQNTNIKLDVASPYTITGMTPGNYTIVVTDERFCRDTLNVEIKAGLVVNATTTPVTCQNPKAGSIRLTLGGTGGTAPYTITGAGANPLTTNTFPFNINNLAAGTYNLTVTDSKSCTGTVSAKVETALDVVLTATAPSNPICGGQDLSINLSNSGTAPYEVSWTGPNGFNGSTVTSTFPVVLKNVPPGNYTVKVTDATGCTGEETTTTGGNPVMQISATAKAVTCADAKAGSITVSFVTPGNPNYTLAWPGDSQNVSNLPFTISGLSAATYVVTITDSKGCTATASAKVESALDVVLIASTPANPLCGGVDLKIDLNGFKGTAPYTVTWDGPNPFDGSITNATLPLTLSNIGSGKYTITVTDATGCSGTETIDVKGVKEPMVVTATGTQVSCQNGKDGMITLEMLSPGTAPYKIDWTGGLPVPNATFPFKVNNLAPGNYCFTVTDANGCTATACAKVETALNVTLEVLPAGNPLCGGADLKIDIAGFKGTPPYKLVWDGPGAFDGMQANAIFPFTLKNVPSGTYNVTVTDATGCSGTETIDLKNAKEPMIVTATGTQVSCGKDDGMITLEMLSPGTAPYRIDWTGGPPVPNATFPFKFNDLKPGEYCFTVTDANGCTATTCATVKFALDVKLTVLEGTQLCGGGSLIVDIDGFKGMAPYTIKLDGPTSGTIPNVPSLPDTIPGLQPGKYTVTVTDKNGCSGIAMAVIKGDTMMQVSLTPTNLLCNGNGKDGKIKITLSNPKTAPYTIKWQPGGQVSNIGVNQFPYTLIDLEANTYVVTVSDINGCSTTASTTLTGGPVDIKVDPTGALTACIDSTIQLKITNLDPKDVLNFSWTTNSPNVTVTPPDGINPTVKATTPGTYTITLTTNNQFGCTDTKTVTVTFVPVQNIDAQMAADLCKGLSVQFKNSSGKNGTWTFGDGKNSTQQNPTHVYDKAGNYIVTFTASEDCVKPFTTTIKVNDVEAVQTDFNPVYKNCSDKAEIQFNDATKFLASGTAWSWTFDPPLQNSTLQNPIITFTQEGTVKATLIVKDVNGCTDTLSKDIKVDFITDKLDNAFQFCPGDSISLNPVGAVQTDIYAWTATPPDPSLNPSSSNPKVSPKQTTVYNLTISTPDKACEVKYTAAVTQKPTVNGKLPKDTVLCAVGPYTLTLGDASGATIEWSTNPNFNPIIGTGSTVTIIPQENGVYYVRASNNTDCPLTGSVKVHDGSIQLDPGADLRICLGEKVVLNLNPKDTTDKLVFKWTPNVTPPNKPEVSPTVKTKYDVLVSNQFNCTATATYNVDVIDINVTASIDGKDTICIGESATLRATINSNVTPVDISWTPTASLNNPNSATPIAKPTETTTYTVTVSYDGLCPDEDEVTLTVMTEQCIEPFIFVPKAFTPNGDNKNDFFVFRGVNLTEVELIVWDRWGEKVYETTDIEAQGWDGTYKGKSLTPDSYAYYFKARCGNGAFYEKKGNVTLLK